MDFKIGKLEFSIGKRTKPAKRRGFDAAKTGRLLNSWVTQNTSVNQELFSDLKKLRARSRDLANNNEYIKRFLSMVKANVVGAKGIKMQARAKRDNGDLDEQDNERLEGGYKKFSKLGNFDVTGTLSRADAERLFIETVARDGEVLVRFVRGYDNAVGFAVQFIEADFLDEELNIDKLENGNAVRMSIEINSWGKPVAYYILQHHPGDYSLQHNGKKYSRVPAEDILHCFVRLRPGQLRGIPWAHASMVALNDLGGFREAAIIAARIGATQMGILYTDGTEFTGDDEEGGAGTGGAPIIDAEPGTFPILPDGMKMEAWDPAYPNAMFGEFTKSALRGISSGIGVSYNGLASDLEGVNYSSLRSGVQEEREGWMVIQQWMIECFADRTHYEWLKYQLLTGSLGLPLRKIEKFSTPDWMPRRWPWVDPYKDLQAKKLGIDNNICSVSSVIREQGNDPDEVFREIQQDRKKFKELEIEPAQAGFLMPGGKPDGDENEDGEDPEKDQK